MDSTRNFFPDPLAFPSLGTRSDSTVAQIPTRSYNRERFEHDAAFEKLSTRQDDVTAKMREAYGQLEVCYTYAQQIDRLLSQKYQVSVSTSAGTMKDVDERLKELSNVGFDGSQDKPPLRENNKGPNTEVFKKP